jgi:hypothetical protein
MEVDIDAGINNAVMGEISCSVEMAEPKEKSNVEDFIRKISNETIYRHDEIRGIANWLAEDGNLDTAINYYNKYGLNKLLSFVNKLQK